MKSLISITLSGVVAAAGAQTPELPGLLQFVEVRPSATLPITRGSAEIFTGKVNISSPFQAQPPGSLAGAIVSFEANARTAWHTHPLGQTLIVTAGHGLVQQEGQLAYEIHPGDIVNIPANVRHWHGASPFSSMTHIAIAEKSDGNSVTWQSKVIDLDYQTALISIGPTQTIPAKKQGDDVERNTKGAGSVVNAKSLSAIQLSIPVIAYFMAVSDMPKLNAALNQGLDTGMSISEAKEILVQLYAYTGFPKSLNALDELLQVLEVRKQRGIHDAVGREPRKSVATGNDLLAIGKANQATISGGTVQGSVFDFAPIINQYLQAHLFGDIFERDNLDWQSRELATIGALAAMPGVEAQLRSHIRASLRIGLSASQLGEVTQILANHGAPDAAGRANDALNQVLAPTPKAKI